MSQPNIKDDQKPVLMDSTLTRAQSLPSNKFVSFVSNDEEDKENSQGDPPSKVSEVKKYLRAKMNIS
jgi:hypothetical protein